MSLFGAIAGGLLGGGLSFLGANQAAKSAESAASKNRQAQRESDRLNYDMFRESRGEGGSAVLPLYLKSANGRLFEDVLGEDTVAAYDAMRPSADSLATMRSRASMFAPAAAGARDTVNDIFDGGVKDEMLANFAPVKSARVKFKRGAALDAMNKTLGEIKAIQTGKGYTGDSLGSNMLKMQGRKSAGDAVAEANISNVEDERAIMDAALNLRLNSLALPGQAARQDLDFFNLPETAYMQQWLNAQQPFNFFRIGTAQAPTQQPLRYDAIPGSGQLAAMAGSQATGSALNYYLQMQQQKQYMDAINRMNMGAYGQFQPMPASALYAGPGGAPA